MRVLWISAVVVLIDQLTKYAVVQWMYRGESIPLVGDWFKFTFTENPGMAFGIQVGPRGLVTVFSMVATALVLWYIYKVHEGYTPYVVSLAFIFGGALGNIVDRVFYGVIMDYGSLFTGRVVDFVHVDIGYVSIPEAVPLLGGFGMSLFPIWNVADMAIVGGVIGIFIFQNQFHRQFLEQYAEEEEEPEAPSAAPSASASVRDGWTEPPAAQEAQAAPAGNGKAQPEADPAPEERRET